MTQSDQGVCVRDVDIESESNRSLVKFEKRNLRLIEFFCKQLSSFDGKKCWILVLAMLTSREHLKILLVKMLPFIVKSPIHYVKIFMENIA